MTPPFRSDNWRGPSLSLRHNPFGAPLSFERPALAIQALDVEAVALRMQAPGVAVELIGPPGVGKTTHLELVGARLGVAVIRIPERGAIPDPPALHVGIVDELQRAASRWTRRRIFGWAASFVVGSHRSFARELRAAGFDVATYELSGLTVDGLRAYAKARMRWATAGPQEPSEVPDALIEQLHRTHRADVRAIEDALFDWAEGKPSCAVERDDRRPVKR